MLLLLLATFLRNEIVLAHMRLCGGKFVYR